MDYSNPLSKLQRKLKRATITQYKFFVAQQKLKSAQKMCNNREF